MKRIETDWLESLGAGLLERDFFQTQLYDGLCSDYQHQYRCGRELAAQLATQLQSASAADSSWPHGEPVPESVTPRCRSRCCQLVADSIHPPAHAAAHDAARRVPLFQDTGEEDSETTQLQWRLQRLQEKQLQLHRDKAESVHLVTRLRAAYAQAEAELRDKDAEIDRLRQELAAARELPDNQATINAPLIPLFDHFADSEEPQSTEDDDLRRP